MTEQPQSLESQIQMARPRRAEVKRVPLTSEEKEFLGEIMKKAVAAEKAGELKEALDLYTDYKNELSRIKEFLVEKEKEKNEGAWDFDRLVDWVKEEVDIIDNAAWHWTTVVFDLTNPPNIVTTGRLFKIQNSFIEQLPPNLIVNGYLDLTGCFELKILPQDLIVNGDIILANTRNEELVKAAKNLKKAKQISGEVIY